MRTTSIALCLLLASCGTPLTRKSAPLGGPQPDEAKVVIYRPSGRMAEKAYPIFDGESLIGFAENRAYFEYFCPPGKRLLWISGATDGGVNADLAAGKTYFLRVRLEIGFFQLRPSLVPVIEGSEELQTLKDDLAACECREYTPEVAGDWRAGRLDEITAGRVRLEGEGAVQAVLRPQDGK